ncbi:CHAT domain-containing protein [Streptomyces specialis]|uniref:CHAT domain-containing protein n=1 Tax=Streptomyces specialis TaxID=498367 RepID=UPI00073F7131|nr:CHAT domain-containing protein [Streptomyces specialis]
MREERLAPVVARLRRITADGDLRPVLEPEALAEAERLAELLDGSGADLRAGFTLGWFHWYRVLALPPGQEQDALEAAIQAFTPWFALTCDGLPPELIPALASAAALTAARALLEAGRSPDPDRASAAVRSWRRVLRAATDTDPAYPMYRYALGVALAHRFRLTGAAEDRDEAIDALRATADAGGAYLPADSQVRYQLGTLLAVRYAASESPADLDEAIERLRASARTAPPDSPHRATAWAALGSASAARFARTGAPADLDAAIEAGRNAVDATGDGDPDHALRLFRLAAAHRQRAGHADSGRDADLAVACLRESLRVAPAGHHTTGAPAATLADALLARFGARGEPADLDAAVDRLREAARGTPPGHPLRATCLSDLGAALALRAGRTGNADDAEAGIAAQRQALDATPPGHPARPGLLSDLGAALTLRAGRTGNADDAEAGIAAQQEAVDATPPDHPARGRRLSLLGSALRARFDLSGDAAALDAAAAAVREAVGLTARGAHPHHVGAVLGGLSAGTGREADADAAIDALRTAVTGYSDPLERAQCLTNLGAALLLRGERESGDADLDAALDALREAADLLPSAHPDRGWTLGLLGTALAARAERSGRPADLDAAIRAHRRSVNATPAGHPDRAGRLTALGGALAERYRHSGDQADVEAGIGLLRAALRAVADDDPRRPFHAAALGRALLARREPPGPPADPANPANPANPADTDTAIGLLDDAVRALGPLHPGRGPLGADLGDALWARHEHTGDATDRERAVDAWLAAARVPTAPTTSRVRAARAAATALADPDPGRAAEAAELAVRLLPLVSSRRLGRGDQQRLAGAFAGLAGEAAALALTASGGTPDGAARALRLLETGRAVLMSASLDVRGDLTGLWERHPHLALRFLDLRDRLDRPVPALPRTTEPAGQRAGDARRRHDRETADRQTLAAEFAALLDTIRAEEGFATFAAPPTDEELLAQASEGPIVVFNVTPRRGDALLVTATGVTALPLPRLGWDDVRERGDSFRDALRATADAPDPMRPQAELAKILAWLWDAAAEPVLRALGLVTTPAGDAGSWPRIWWVPGGPLSTLPLHAAGHHTPAEDPAAPRSVLDRVVSSYTPTIRALHHARDLARRPVAGGPPGPARRLIVAMPVTPGFPDGGRLRFVPAEAAMLRAHWPDAVLLTEPDPGPAGGPPPGPADLPTKANVLAHLAASDIVHFGCHADSHPADPSLSRLFLHDHAEDPFTVAGLVPVTLDRARLVYISACRTAAVDAAALRDEAIHLAATFQLAGFPHVVGTQWEVGDLAATTLSTAFYAHLHDGRGTARPERAAHALHTAVRSARRLLWATPSLWAAHLHSGA